MKSILEYTDCPWMFFQTFNHSHNRFSNKKYSENRVAASFIITEKIITNNHHYIEVPYHVKKVPSRSPPSIFEWIHVCFFNSWRVIYYKEGNPQRIGFQSPLLTSFFFPALLVCSGLASRGRQNDANNEPTQSQGFSKYKDKDHTNE